MRGGGWTFTSNVGPLVPLPEKLLVLGNKLVGTEMQGTR